ncbi:unnamed protein product [Paramecium sonneborni]|uniref:Uncharacterized protein n=1 Tax=Paramecium sonneborni TaxID=65129 RepID=A0A8S1RB35_9CILI|nr:unnamed protein product [Paramecium sonneborni]
MLFLIHLREAIIKLSGFQLYKWNSLIKDILYSYYPNLIDSMKINSPPNLIYG